MEISPEELSLTPPNADRVAARALVLAAVSCRALIEKDVGKAGAEELRRELCDWLERVGAAGELEDTEADLIFTPLGELDEKTERDAGWRSEGMVVLAWALGCVTLPPVHLECEPSGVANAMGFLDDHQSTPLHCPRLNSPVEIERWANIYLTLHWRLRKLEIEPGAIDLVRYVSDCTWGALRLDELEIQDRDLAVNGVVIHKVDYWAYRHILSITQERHQAFNWLLGFEPIYSQVTTDT